MVTTEEFLKHHGVKGMKWGVRKDRGHEGQRAKTRKIDRLDRRFERNAQGNLGLLIRVHDTAAKQTNKVDIPRINNKREYKGKDFTRDSPLRQKYYAEHQKAFLDNLEKAAVAQGTNASGTRQYGILEGHNGSWNIVAKDVKKVKHADDEEVLFNVKVHYDPKGFVLSVDLPEAEQGGLTAEGFLAHYGVKGMKWGKRKQRGSGGHSGASVGKEKPRKLSDDELKSAIARMELEKKYSELSRSVNPKKQSATAAFIADIGKDLAKNAAKTAGTMAINQALGITPPKKPEKTN